MSEHHVEVVTVGPVLPHPDPATTSLELTQVHGYPVVIAKGTFKEGDKAVYVPVDAIVPSDDPRWAFLGEHTRIRARKLRGVFSMGLLTPADPTWEVGQDVAAELRIGKYEAIVGNPEQDESDPGIAPVYDLEGWRRMTDLLPELFPDPNEEVVATEKLHGENCRYAWYQGRLWCGSHKNWKLDTPSSQWWNAARLYGLAEKLSTLPADRPLVFFAEVIGHVPDMNYGFSSKARGLAFFDVLDVQTRTMLSFDEFEAICSSLFLPMAPVLYRGPFSGVTPAMAEGMTTFPRAAGKHIREGFVVKPVKERQHLALGRVVLKFPGEGYHLRKKG